jgi:hypothetical protein
MTRARLSTTTAVQSDHNELKKPDLERYGGIAFSTASVAQNVATSVPRQPNPSLQSLSASDATAKLSTDRHQPRHRLWRQRG